MGFDESDGLRGDPGAGLGSGDDGGLGVGAGGGVAHFLRTVVVDRRATHDGVDGVSVGEGFIQPLEDHHARSAADHRPRGASVEGAAVAVRREDAALLVEVAGLQGQADAGTAGQGQVAVAKPKALAGLMDGHQGGGTGGLDGHARSAQTQEVGDAGGQEVSIIGHEGLEMPHVLQKLFLGNEMSAPIGTLADTGEQANGSGEGLRVAGCVLEGAPRRFQEETVLWIENLRLAVGQTEEGRIEEVHIVQDTGGSDMVWMVEPGRIQHIRGGLLLGEEGDRLHTSTEIAPEGLHIGSLGKTSGQADDGDRRKPGGIRSGLGKECGTFDGARWGGLRWGARDPRGEGGDRGVLEKVQNGNFLVEGFAKFLLQSDEQEGMATEVEKIVFEADVVDLQDLLPDASYGVFGRRVRRGLWRGGGLGFESLAGLQGFAVDLAARRQGPVVEGLEGAWNHVLGQGFPEETTQLRTLRWVGAHGQEEAHQARIPRGRPTDEDLGLPDLRMPVDHGFHFPGLDSEASDLHLVIGPTQEIQLSVLLPPGQVAGAIETLTGTSGIGVRHEALRGLPRPPQVAPGQAGACQTQLAAVADRDQMPSAVGDQDLGVVDRSADGGIRPFAPMTPPSGPDGGFRGAVEIEEVALRISLGPAIHEVGGAGFTGGDHGTDARKFSLRHRCQSRWGQQHGGHPVAF